MLMQLGRLMLRRLALGATSRYFKQTNKLPWGLRNAACV